MLEVKQAVRKALDHTQQLFKEENISNLGLEEVDYDQAKGEWIVTVGFSRPWDYPQGPAAAFSHHGGLPNRTYKEVRVRNDDGQVVSVRNHAVHA